MLIGVAIGALYGFRGTSVVIVGQGFSNNLTQYDDFSAGARFTEADLRPFSVTVKDFDVRFETGPVQRGAARLFRANVEVTERPGAAPRQEVLEVNKPLHVGGTTVHLIGHGYAPKVTVKDAQGNVAFSGPVVMLPQDSNFTSLGVIKAPDARPERLAFEALFLPTAVLSDRARSRPSPMRSTPRCLPTSGTARRRWRRGSLRTSIPSTPPGLTQLKRERRPAGANCPQRR